MPLAIGQPAPEFTVTTADGRELALADFRGKKHVVLYFYPADFTPVCTKEACGFRDAYADLASRDTEVIGVSVDDAASHRKFAEKYQVPFALVSDPGRALSEKYGATGGLLDLVMKKSRRVTYVIDKHGVIAGVFVGELSATKHVEGARRVIAGLGA